MVHVYYPDLLPGLPGPLGHIDEPFDLFVTNASGQPLEISSDHLSRMREVTVIPVRNLGRDIFPFMQLLAAGRLDSYELLLKLHTKKSAWRDEYVEKTRRGEVSAGLSGGGDEWRNGLVDGLVGSSDVVESVVFHFDDEPQLGLVVPSGNLLGSDFWGYNADLVGQLCGRAGITLDPESLRFPAGSMYWCRVSAARLLLRLQLSAKDFQKERGQTDGTTAHAVERVLGLLVTDASFRMSEVAPGSGT